MYEYRNITNHTPQPYIGSSFELLLEDGLVYEAVPGFRTLEVAGRGVVGNALQTQDVPHMEGVLLEHVKREPRVLLVRYMITAGTALELRRRFELLNKLLHGGEKKVSFADDSAWYYIGVLQNADENVEVTNTLQGVIYIYCAQPFKYSQTANAYNGTSVSIPPSPAAVKYLTSFIFVANTNAAIVRLHNSAGQSIAIGPVVSGRTYTLELGGRRVTVLENGVRKMSLLGAELAVERFVLTGPFTLSTGGALTVLAREVRL